MNLYEKTVNKKYFFKGKVINVRIDDIILPNGKKSKREIVEHDGSVAIVPIKKDSVLLVEQYRKATDKVMLELPAGKLENIEEPRSCAQRELNEEVGYTAKYLKFLGSFYTSPGYSTEIIHLFLANALVKPKTKKAKDYDEFINLKEYTYKELFEKMLGDSVQDAKTVLGLLLLKEYLKEHKNE